MKADILCIDGKHLLWRTYDAFKNLYIEYEDGTILGTGGVYGFLTTLIGIYNKYGGMVVIAWEGKNNFRYKLYPKYKDRGELNSDKIELLSDMKEQEKRLKAILRAIGIKQYYGVGCEADDVMANLATVSKNKTIIVYTGDSDLRQLVNEKIFVVSPNYKAMGDTIYDAKKVLERHEIESKYISDLKAIAGDHSDNISGVKGIGEKLAAKLINEFGDTESIILATKKINTGRISKDVWPINLKFIEVILNSVEDIRLFKKLTTVKKDCKIKLIEPKRDLELVRKYYKAYRFISLMYGNEFNSVMRMANG